MSNLDIHELLKTDKKYMGCNLSRIVPDIPDFSYIIQFLPGLDIGHWILIYRKKIYYIFDSENIPRLLGKLIFRRSLEICKNDTDFQVDSSNLCGPYSIYIAKLMNSGLSFNDALDSLDIQDYRANKKKLLDFF